LRTIDDQAAATRQALITELSEKHDQVEKQIKQLEVERQDIQFKLASLRGELVSNSPKRPHVPDEAIVALLQKHGGRTTGEIQAHFEFSSATVCRRLSALLGSCQVTMEQQATTKIWKVRN
jgi:predicted HTH transcriptional regulator